MLKRDRVLNNAEQWDLHSENKRPTFKTKCKAEYSSQVLQDIAMLFSLQTQKLPLLLQHITAQSQRLTPL